MTNNDNNMNNRYSDDCCHKNPCHDNGFGIMVDIESDNGLKTKDIDFTLRFYVYGSVGSRCFKKSDLLVSPDGDYYAPFKESDLMDGLLFCDTCINENDENVVRITSNTGILLGCNYGSAPSFEDKHSKGYKLSFTKVDRLPDNVKDPSNKDILITEEVFKEKMQMPELTADRAISDENGNRITDTYVTRKGLTNHIKDTYNQQFTENPPLIMNGYITPEMLSEETRQMLESTGQEITNLPDSEDISSVHGVLKFSNKQYNAGAYSGLGRQYLRKNIVAGKNILTQSMIKWSNTIYVIQYDYNLQGEEITVPEGCVLDFQGGSLNNGRLTLSNTLLFGDIKFESDCIVQGAVRNNEVLIDWFGASNDGKKDCSSVFRNVFSLVYNTSNNNDSAFNKYCPIIKLSYGKYLISSPIITEDSDLKYGTFTIQGTGVANTVVEFAGDNNEYLIYNKEIFAYTTFSDIRFVGNDQNNFMYLYATETTGRIPQSITFNRCRFGQFKTVIKSEGNAMCSEITFNLCKVVYFKNTEAELFVFNNLQAVNWRFFGTDIEQTNGTVFKLKKGTYISLYSCSIIPFSGKFIDVPSDADANTFWYTNSPQLCLHSCRFEMRGSSQLYVCHSRSDAGAMFNECAMGGLNISDPDVYQIEIVPGTSIKNQSKIVFNNCTTFDNYRFNIGALASDYNNGYVKFNNCRGLNINTIVSQSILPDLWQAEFAPGIIVDGANVIYNYKYKFLNKKNTRNYILKPSSGTEFIPSIQAGEVVRIDSSTYFKINEYIGAISFNINPTVDISISIFNTAQTKLYSKFSVKAFKSICHTVAINEFISSENGIIITVTNTSGSQGYVSGVALVSDTYGNMNQLVKRGDFDVIAYGENGTGIISYDNQYKKPVVWDGLNACWRDCEGFRTMIKRSVTTEELGAPNQEDVGLSAFDKTSGKPVWWNGTKWVDATGTEI